MRAASKIGKGAEQYAHHVKGQELPLHEPRGKTGLALAYALSPTGADHCEAAHDPIFEMPGKWLQSVACLGILAPVDSLDLGPRKVRLFIYLQQIFNLYNSVGMCNFVGIPFGPLPFLNLSTVSTRQQDGRRAYGNCLKWAKGPGRWPVCSTPERGCRQTTTHSRNGFSLPLRAGLFRAYVSIKTNLDRR